MRAVLPFMPSIVRAAVMRCWPRLDYVPRFRSVRLGDLRRLTPVSSKYGFDRGTPVDRYYISQFLSRYSQRIHGRVLEVGDRGYTERYGADRVSRSDVLNVRAGIPGTTIVADLTHGEGIADASFDCIVLTQTLHLLFDVAAAVRTLHRILKPGGTLLLTVPGTISQIESGPWKSVWHWGFTRLSIERLLCEVFRPEAIETVEYGNVLASIAFLTGLASEELRAAELDHRDPLYPLLIGVRATRAL
jgi:SAM-dependent methyltransferase